MTEMNGPRLTDEQASLPGELLAAVSRSLVQLYKEC
jgi:hypothetical protein